MPIYKFVAAVYISAANETEAKIRAAVADDNIREVTGHAPYTCIVQVDEDSCEESDYDPENEYFEIEELE